MNDPPLRFLEEPGRSEGPPDSHEDPSRLYIDDDDRYGRLRLIPWWRQERLSAARVLVIYCGIGAGLLVVAAFGPAASAIWFVIASNLVMGPCWPTIFGQTLDTIEDKRYQETGGAILVMAIVGGAVIPVVQGAVSDALGSLQMSFVVSAVCFLGILLYFRSNLRHHVLDEPSTPAMATSSGSGTGGHDDGA